MAGTERQDDLISALYHEMFPMLLAYARSALGGSDMAEEAVQETFCVACKRQRELTESPNPRGWLVNTLKNVIRQLRRNRTREAALLAALTARQDGEDNSARSEADPDLLYGDLQRDPDYLLLKRLALDQCTMAKLAAELGISVEACKKRVQRARKRLQKRLERNL
ncbi:MAG: sigma-70 family RNA polymerase sigma factor [Clostridiales bacterium]|nr:sigma-70 family RNA polymerase sigma factor [Clostridiales bacterium]